MSLFVRRPKPYYHLKFSFFSLRSMHEATAAACVIATEVLNGKTLDTNSNYLGPFLLLSISLPL